MMRTFFNFFIVHQSQLIFQLWEKILLFSVYVYLSLSNYNGGAHLFFILFKQDENWVFKTILVYNFINFI